MDVLAYLGPRIVHESDREIGAQRVPQQVAHQHLPSPSRADDKHQFSHRRVQISVLDPPIDEPRPAQHEGEQQTIEGKTDRGMAIILFHRKVTKAATTTPVTTARTIRSRSGIEAKRQTPR